MVLKSYKMYANAITLINIQFFFRLHLWELHVFSHYRDIKLREKMLISLGRLWNYGPLRATHTVNDNFTVSLFAYSAVQRTLD